MVFLCGFVQLPIVDTYSPFTIFLGYNYERGDPLAVCNRIYKSYFQEVLNLFLHYVPKIGVHSSLRMAHRPRVTFNINMMGAHVRGNTPHVCILPGEFLLVFFQEIDQALLFT